MSRSARVMAELTRANHHWRSSEQLSKALGMGKPQIAAAISEARKQLGAVIESHSDRGIGWRLPPGGVLPVKEARQPAVDLHVKHRAALELLEILGPRVAERVREVALQSGQNGAGAIERLIWYGLEVHSDLVAAGDHPLQLERAA